MQDQNDNAKAKMWFGCTISFCSFGFWTVVLILCSLIFALNEMLTNF